MYESFYRLNTKPFGLNPDPDFIFTRKGHELAMAHLRYGISQSTGFVVITGAPGTGKTTLARVLLKELSNNTTIVVAHLPNTHLTANDLLRVVADSFGLKHEGLSKAEILKLLNSFLLTCVRERKRTLLVIDEAQNLPVCALEELRLLANLRLGAKALLQTILLGQEQFRQMLGAPEFSQIKQRVVANYHLVALTLEETQAYIESRLIHANWQGNPHFSHEAIDCIHEHTDGIPHRINKFCERLLLYGYLEERTEISKDIIQVVINEFQQETTPSSLRKPENTEDEDDEITQTDALTVSYKTENNNIEDEEAQINTPDEFKENEDLLMDSSTHADTDDYVENDTSTLIPTKSIQPDTENSYAEVFHEKDLPSFVEHDNNSFDGLIDEPIPAVSMPSDSDMFAQMPQEQENPVDESEPILQEAFIEEKTIIADKPELEVIASIEAVKLTNNNAIAMGYATQPSLGINEASPTNRAKLRVIDGGKENRQFSKPQSKPGEEIESKLLKLVLAFQLSPKHFEYLTDPGKPPPNHTERLLEIATMDSSTIATALPKSLQGISNKNLQVAINFYIWEVLLKPRGNDYRALGLQDNAPINKIKNHYQHLKAFLKTQQAERNDTSEYIARIEKAYTALTNETGAPPQPSSSVSKQKNHTKTAHIEEAYKILSKETIAPTEVTRPVFNKPDSSNKSGMHTKYLIFGLIATAIGIGIYKTQFDTHESESSIAEIESTDSPSKKAIIFGKNNNNFEKIEGTIKPEEIEKSIKDDANINIAPPQNATEESFEDFSFSDEEPAPRPSAASNVQELPEGQPKVPPKPAPVPQEEIITTPELTQQDPEVTEPAETITKELPLATLYPDTIVTNTVTSYNNIEKVDLINLISHFTIAYEQGDIQQFMRLFSIDATGFDGAIQADRNGIEADYIDLFQTTDSRQIAIKDIAWNTNNNLSKGISDFVVTVKNVNSDNFEFISGVITFEVEKTKPGLFITKIAYQLSE